MPPPATAAVKDGDRSFELRVDACRVLLGGEFAGHVEVDLACPADDVARAADCLRVQVAGKPPSDAALGNGDYAPGVQLIFWADWSTGLQALPEEVTLLWGDTPIASVVPTLKDSVPIEEKVRSAEPGEILDSFPVSTSNLVLLAASRAKWWYPLAGLLVVSDVLVGLALPRLELPHTGLNWASGGILLAAGFGVGLFPGRIPCQQVWPDRDRRRVLIIDGRTGSPGAKLARAHGRSLDDFDHVRVFMRWQIAHDVDGRDQEIWLVMLEGRIPFASANSSGWEISVWGNAKRNNSFKRRQARWPSSPCPWRYTTPDWCAGRAREVASSPEHSGVPLRRVL